MEAERLGHSLDAVDIGGIPTMFCRSCGAHGSWQWRGLLTGCPGEPRTAQADKWLALARQGIGPPKQDFKKHGKRRYTRRKPLRPKLKHSFSTERSALSNKGLATTEDKLRWTTLDGGKCRCKPCKPPERVPAQAQAPPPGPASPAEPGRELERQRHGEEQGPLAKRAATGPKLLPILEAMRERVRQRELLRTGRDYSSAAVMHSSA